MLHTVPIDSRTESRQVVSVEHLRVRYGDLIAVQDVSFSINRGEIFGILGPNGAGKTTTVECIGGLRQPDSGTISLLGLDVQRDRDELRQRVGIQLQSSELPDKLRVAEALELFAAFYDDPADPAALLEQLGLTEKRDARFASLSGGQRQRLSIALALVGQPEIAILDELTTGLDPQARRETWKLIEGLRDRGVTVILVTHFMEEAERLCDRLALIHHGRVRAIDTPAKLAGGDNARERISFVPRGKIPLSTLRALRTVDDATLHGDRIDIHGHGDLIADVMEALVKAGVVPQETHIEPATLDDAFVALTAETHEEAS